MDDQITLIGFEAPDSKESNCLDKIFPTLQEIAAQKGVPVELLTRKATQTDSASSGYTVVAYHGSTAFRLKMRGKQYYISVPALFDALIPAEAPRKQTKSEEGYIRVLVDSDHPVESYTDFLAAVTGMTIDRLPTEWSCCSRYMECSDAKTCVHPDKVFALDCGYRKVLNSGRVFYGKNRNID